MGVLKKPVHQRIFSLFLDHHELPYNEIVKRTGIRSNLLNYHLQQLVHDGLLEKRNDAYAVPKTAEYLIPHFKQLIGEERLKLPVVLFAIEHKNKILLIRREQRPYQDYWSLPGGKIQNHETLSEAAQRIALRETGIPIRVTEVCTVIDERVMDDHAVKNGWFLFLVKAAPCSTPKSLPKNCDWFDPKDLNGRIIPSDKWMVQHALTQRINVHQFLVEETDGRILDFKKL